MAKILVSNDDGIDAPGLTILADVLSPEHELLVIAPAEPCSAIGHAITLGREVELHRADVPGAKAFALGGTPADCVKLGVTTLCTDCDLVVSGINRGPNVGVNILYSGTVAAALEAAIQGKHGVALSVDYPEDGSEPSYEAPARFAVEFIGCLLRSGRSALPPVLNINFPAASPWKGVQWSRQSRSGFREYYSENEKGGWPRRFQVDGDYLLVEEALDFDACALKAGYVSVTPLGLDLTHDVLGKEGEEARPHVLDAAGRAIANCG